MELTTCSECGRSMERFETVKGRGNVDWSLEDRPICPVCRGVPGAKPLVSKHDVTGGTKKAPTSELVDDRIIARRKAIAEKLSQGTPQGDGE